MPGCENFLLYDFFTPEGHVNENVFAYSNRAGDERALVVYHNKFGDTRGWIRTSAAYLDKSSRGLVQKSIGEGLALPNDPDLYVTFRDPVRGLEYIRNSAEIHNNGLNVELGAYQYRVFLDFRVIQDNAWKHYAQLTAYLNGGGVPNIEEALQEIFLQPVHRAYRELINAGSLNWLLAHHSGAAASYDATRAQAFAEAETKLGALLGEIRHYTNAPGDVEALAGEILQDIKKLLALPGLGKSSLDELKPAAKYLLKGRATSPALASYEPPVWGALLTWAITRKLGKLLDATPEGTAEQSRSWIDEWMLSKIIRQALQDLGADEGRAEHLTGLVRLLTGQQNWYDPQVPAGGASLQRPARAAARWTGAALHRRKPLPGCVVVQSGKLREAAVVAVHDCPGRSEPASLDPEAKFRRWSKPSPIYSAWWKRWRKRKPNRAIWWRNCWRGWLYRQIRILS